jgi:hypothetical protein
MALSLYLGVPLVAGGPPGPDGLAGSAVILVGRIPRKGNPRRATMQCVATQHLTRKKEGQPHPTNSFYDTHTSRPEATGIAQRTLWECRCLREGVTSLLVRSYS